MILDKINSIDDLKKMQLDDFPELAKEIREYIIDVISKNGGHLASSLGVVELTIALHYVFNTPQDKIIWDVGHQTYAHKILTGRRNRFPTIRKFKGLSGFPKRSESPFDTYNVGHSSTSLSLAHGEAVGRDIKNENHKVIAVIGDGSIVNGMAFEALNQIGHRKNDMIIILNDNEHSICKNVGAMAKYFNRIITHSFYNKVRRKSMEALKNFPGMGDSTYNFIDRFFESFKSMIIPGQLFEDLGVRYFGPVDGHDIYSLINMLTSVKNINFGPKLIHVLTKKGMGYRPAEMDPARFHGIGPFDKKTGVCIKKDDLISYSEIAGKTLAEIAEKDDKVIALTAAMKIGTGLFEFENRFPERFFDVGIAEQHAVTFAGALASTGLKPFVSIYSTFLQRAVDQLIHDIALMNLQIKLLIDRSGIVGDDGETHHGIFDISIIKNIPNFIILAPSTGDELRDMLYFASQYNEGPVAIRYPRGRSELKKQKKGAFHEIRFGKAKTVARGNDLVIFAIGDMIEIALEVRKILKKKSISVSVVNLMFIKPLDIKLIENAVKRTEGFLTMENGIISGGVGEYIVSNIKPHLKSKLLFNVGFPDESIKHGSTGQLFRYYSLDAGSVSERILKAIEP